MAEPSSYIDREKVFAHLDRMAAWRAGEKPAPVTVEWDLSNRCSLGCSQCHFAYTHTRGPLAGSEKPGGVEHTGDVADTALVLRALLEAKQAGVQGVVWSGGGEPTLHPDFETVTDYAHSVGLQQGMYTHGGHIDARRAAHIAERFTWVVVSIDCADAESYAQYKQVPRQRFWRALDGVRFLTAADGDAVVGASFLLSAENWREAWKMLELARPLGVDYITFRPLILYDVLSVSQPIGDRAWVDMAEMTLQLLAAEPDVVCDVERFRMYAAWQGRSYPACLGIRYNTTITPDGRVWLCPNRRGFPGSCLGDLRSESFAATWARHPGQWTDFRQCRTMCRLHLQNIALASVEQPRQHTAFV